MVMPSLSLGLLAGASSLLPLALVVAGESAPSATLSSVRSAATAIAVDQTEAGVGLFDDELLQLTDDSLKSALHDESLAPYVSLFDFDHSNGSDLKERRSSSSDDCKLLPGDDAWPEDFVWRLFDRLLGGALTGITPIAAPCYPDSSYDNYDPAKCDSIVSNFTTAELQCVNTYLLLPVTPICLFSVARSFVRWNETHLISADPFNAARVIPDP